MPPHHADKSPLTGAAYGTLAALIWGGFPAITKLAMASDTLTAWDITALRFGVAGLILLPIFLRRGLGTMRWPVALLLACGAGAPYVLLTAGGLAFAPAGHMGVITPSCMLLGSTLGSWLVLREPLHIGRVIGALTIFGGILMLGWDGLTNHGEQTWIGDLMFVMGGVFWASYTIGSRVWSVEPFHATVVVAVLSMAIYLPGYALLAEPQLATAPWSEIVIQAVFQGLLSAIVALLLYTRAVAILGAARGAVFAALVPTSRCCWRYRCCARSRRRCSWSAWCWSRSAWCSRSGCTTRRSGAKRNPASRRRRLAIHATGARLLALSAFPTTPTTKQGTRTGGGGHA